MFKGTHLRASVFSHTHTQYGDFESCEAEGKIVF
jgi:hypothetical protein